MNIPQIVAEFSSKTRQLRIKRQKHHKEIQREPDVEQIAQLNANLKKQIKLIQTTTANIRHQLINQLSEKTQICTFQLPNLVSLFRTHFTQQYPHFSHPEPIRKINKLTEKFLTSEYDFTDQQVMGLLLYSYTYDWQRIPEERDFQLVQRIITKLSQFNHFDYGFVIAFEQLMTMMLILYESGVEHGFAKMVKILHIMHKFKLVEININAIKHSHHPHLYTCLEILDINLMIVGEISRDYVKRDSEVSNSSLLKLNESDTNIVNDLAKLYMDFVPQCLQLMHTSTSPKSLQILLSYLTSLSKFQRLSLDKKTFNIKKDSLELQPLTQHNKLRPFEQQLAELMYQHGIVDWLMTNRDWLMASRAISSIRQIIWDDVLTVLELIVFRVTVKELRDKLFLLIDDLLQFDFVSLKCNWLIEFVHCNAKPQNASLFREIFVESSLLKRIEDKIQAFGAYLEDNFFPNTENIPPAIFYKSQKFVYGTIFAIGIYRACDLPPSKVVLISAEIVLKLLLNCYWLNEYMQIFLSQHPFADNKMEIEQ